MLQRKKCNAHRVHATRYAAHNARRTTDTCVYNKYNVQCTSHNVQRVYTVTTCTANSTTCNVQHATCNILTECCVDVYRDCVQDAKGGWLLVSSGEDFTADLTAECAMLSGCARLETSSDTPVSPWLRSE